MITLSRKIKKDVSTQKKSNSNCGEQRISIRDLLLLKEVQEMEQFMPNTCTVHFPDPNILSEFTLKISPDEGYWMTGSYLFSVFVPEDYNMSPPKVKCLTKLWHPNISVKGEICLSILRHNIDGFGWGGWAPTRKLKDVIWGLNSLFTDLLNFDDPLNCEAAEQYQRDKYEFQAKVQYYVSNYAVR